MGNTLYLECCSGISGDMTVAALLDLGGSEEILKKVLSSLPLEGFQVKVSRVIKSGIDACDFHVILEEENHDHDMGYLHGHVHEEGGEAHSHAYGECEAAHSHVHGECEAAHSHVHENAQGHGAAHGHHHQHRGMKEIREIIEKGSMTERARSLALKIFEILARAEAKAHNCSVEEVHFHEVGAVDSIVDIVSAAVLFDDLDIIEVIVPVLCEGTGTIRCQHGILPVPVPAVANIVQTHKLPLTITEVQGELVTPTGAAIVAAVRTCGSLPKNFCVKRIGTGAGKRQYQCPGILRAMLLEDQSREQDEIYKLETNIDDCTGENLGYVMELLFQAGARDVNYTPVFMKKNRPAWLLTVLCTEEKISQMEDIIFRETTTIGIRRVRMERTILPRQELIIETPYGKAQIKVCSHKGVKKYYPEHESTAALCRKNKIPYQEMYQKILQCCEAEGRA